MSGIPSAVRVELVDARSRAPQQLRKDVDDDAAVGLVVRAGQVRSPGRAPNWLIQAMTCGRRVLQR